MKKLFNMNTKNIWSNIKALVTTAIWSGFIVVSFFTALSLRGDINLQPWADGLLGTLQGAYGLAALGLIIFQGQKNKDK